MAAAVIEPEVLTSTEIVGPLCVVVDYNISLRAPEKCPRAARWRAIDWCANGHEEENLLCHFHREHALSGAPMVFYCEACGAGQGPVPTQWVRL